MIEVQARFAYSDLSPDTRTIVEAATDRLHALVRKTGEQIIEIGRELIAVKDALSHGQFGPWLEAEFGWTDRTAQNFMSVAHYFSGKSETVSLFQAKALYALASGHVPESIRTEFIERAEAGERITHKDVKARLSHKETMRIAEEMRKPTKPELTIRDPDDIAPCALSDLPYDRVDPVTGEILDEDVPNPVRVISTPRVQERRPTEPQEDIEARANTTAADIVARHGVGQAVRIARAIFRQTGGEA